MQLTLFKWKIGIDQYFESSGAGKVLSLSENTASFHQAYVPLYEPPLPVKEAKILTTSSCQVAKQYAYVTKYYSGHVTRDRWQQKWDKQAFKDLLDPEKNPELDLFICRNDHKWFVGKLCYVRGSATHTHLDTQPIPFLHARTHSKRLPSKSETEQGYDMGNRGMSTHGFQITFAVEMLHVGDVDGTITKQRYLVTVQMDVVYSQSSEQTLPEVRQNKRCIFICKQKMCIYM